MPISAMILAGSLAFAQSAPVAPNSTPPAEPPKAAPLPTEKPATTTSNSEGDEVVQLSPFEVSAGEDTGYQAANTASGSRLNTSLRDTAAAIQPLTKEFLSDIGANNIDDILGYANFEAEFQDGAGFNSPETRLVDNTNNSFRQRGQAGSFSIDIGQSAAPIDFSDTERVEIASGPNSILFGFGATGGVVSLTTKRANVNRNANKIVWQFGSYNLKRGEFDFNRVLMKRKLAVRLWGVYGDREGWRRYDFEDQKRINAGIRFLPWKNTDISVSGGIGEQQRHSTVYYNATDQITLWRNQGAQSSDANAASLTVFQANGNINTAATNALRNPLFNTGGLVLANGPAVFQVIGSSPAVFLNVPSSRLTFIENGGEVFNLDGELTTRGGANNSENGRSLLPPSLSPFDYSLTGPGAIFTNDFNNVSARLEQRITKDLIFEGAWSRNSAETTLTNYQLSANAVELSGDPNITTPQLNGGTAPNTYRGRLYMETLLFPDEAKIDNQLIRGSLAYELKLGRWLGRHRFLGMYENSIFERDVLNRIEIAVDQNSAPFLYDPDNAAVGLRVFPESGVNRIWRRNYVTEGEFGTYNFGDFRTQIPSFTSGPRTFTARQINRGGGNGGYIKRNIDTLLFNAQSFWLKGRVVTTFGYRTDDTETTDRNGIFSRRTAADPGVISGQYVLGELYPDAGAGSVRNADGITRTAGVVAHLTPRKRISAYYNQSSNFGENILGRTIFPRRTPPPTFGDGRDYGLMFDVLGDDRVFLRINRFESTQIGRAAFVPQGVAGVHYFSNSVNPIVLYLAGIGRLSPGDALQQQNDASFSAFSTDTASRGFEIDLTTNLRPNWTARISYSYTDRGNENYFAEREPLLSEWIALWQSLDDGGTFPVTIGNQTTQETVQSMIDRLNRDIATNVSDAVGGNNGSRPHKFSLTTRYGFRSGWIKGAYIGGSYNYSVRPKQTTPAGRPDLFSNIEQIAMFTGYKYKPSFWKSTWNLQLNVTNVFNRDLQDAGRWNDPGTGLRRYYFNAPRAYRLTTTVDF